MEAHKKNYSVSLAIIVRNSAAVIGRCLESLKGLPDEIIIVDTGSTDNTKEIVNSFMDDGLIVKLYDFKWINDFSAARNFAFSKCTKDWIFWVDSDDIVNPFEKRKIENLDLAHTDKDQILFLYDYAQDAKGETLSTFYRERMLRRSANPTWKGKIHEYIPAANYSREQIIITHKRQSGDSAERNIKLLRSAIEFEEDKELLARYYYYIGKELYDVKDWPAYKNQDYEKKAMAYFAKFLSMGGLCWWEDAAIAALLLAKYYYAIDEDLFMEYLLKAIKIDSTRAEPYYYMGIFYSDRQRWEQAIPWYSMCVQVKPASDLMAPLLDYEKGFNTWLPCLQLCLCYNGLGKIKEAYDWNEKAIAFGSKDSRLFHNREALRNALPSLAIAPVQPSNKKSADNLFYIKHIMDGQGKKLNLGCGSKTLPGYENADNFKADFVDAVYNLYDIPYEDGTISEVLSEHALEHLGKELGERAIKEWARVLRPGGLLHLKIPDLALCISNYLTADVVGAAATINGYPAKEWHKYTIYGIQKSQAGESDQSQYHVWGYSKNEIRDLLSSAGFVIDSLENYDGWGTPSIEIKAHKKVAAKKVGWWYPEDWDFGPVRIRALNIDKWLKAKGYNSEIIANVEQGALCDIVIVGDFSEHTLQGIKELRKRGIIVICNLCEELHHESVYSVLKECDTVVCCSTKLAEWAKQYSETVTVIEDAYETK